MPASFDTNPVFLKRLLEDCAGGRIKLPDFQRSWVWEEDRIMSLIASVSRGFPVGALMTLKSPPAGEIIFAYRPIQGAPAAAEASRPDQLLLDGQQRMTSLYQSCMRKEVVETITAKKRVVRRWFYIDIRKAVSSEADRDSAIFAVPGDRKLKANFDRDVVLDLSTPEHEYEQLMYPLNSAFDWDEWQDGFGDYWTPRGRHEEMRQIFRRFKDVVLRNFADYQVPVISLGSDTSHEAVCLVFEKVNTGGKALDAFELLTAMYAAQGHRLRDDWLGTTQTRGLQEKLKEYGRAADQKVGVLSGVAATDFLQAIALLHTNAVRRQKREAGVAENDLPAVRATRQSLLDLPLEAYQTYCDPVHAGFERVARFLRQQQIHRVRDLPYQTQLVSLAAIFADIGERAEHGTNLDKIARWYWCGVFGELYGSAVESRFARDIVEVPAWLDGGPEPATVRDGVLRADRLLSMRSRLSAAYKGMNALLMREGARDFRSGQTFDQAVFFDEAVDIHHIFPKAWCLSQGHSEEVFDSVINKTPLSLRTNRIVGGVAPSEYLAKLEAGRERAGQRVDPAIAPDVLDGHLRTHCIPVQELRADDFDAFMAERQKLLLSLVARVTGHAVAPSGEAAEEGEDLSQELAHDAGLDAVEAN
jgi:hypothetical protein